MKNKTAIKVEKPWGYELHLGKWLGWRLKLLHVEEGHRTSLHYHASKDEMMFYLDGRMQRIFPQKVHRLTGPVEVLEVSMDGDNDVIRVEDDYGRTS